MSTDYNPLAASYDEAIPNLPQEYIDLIVKTFTIGKSSKIIDLGCGTGLLTLPLAEFSDNIQALDLSEKMLDIAKSKSASHSIEWVHSSVEKFHFTNKSYDLILGLESFHEFLNLAFIRKCFNALTTGGALAHGWINFHWEEVLREEIIRLFSNVGIPWGNWDYYECPEFSQLIQKVQLDFSDVKHLQLRHSEITSIESIALYLVSIDKVASLTEQQRTKLYQSLLKELPLVVAADKIAGESIYNLRYTLRKN
jgi:2-polyprenyl-3-methyl-5-hydroxy-6-metoxy-1,4-benzoquinol methylase